MITSICQPHFFPWLGYFNMIHLSEYFIFLDNVQYNRRSWQNRVHIRSSLNSDEKKFISLSIKNNSRNLNINTAYFYIDSIEKIERVIHETYKNTLFYNSINKFILDLFYENKDKNLATFNIQVIIKICKYLNIDLNFELSSNFNLSEKKQDLILSLLKKSNSDIYLANNGSIDYVNKEFFDKNGVNFVTHDYQHPKYQQFSKKELNFIQNLSIIDLLFNYEKKSEDVIKLYTHSFI